MSEADRAKWDTRYREGSYEARTWPSPFLETWLGRPPRTPGARALDVACGAGRNAIYLARAGFRVDAIDISREGLKQARDNAAALGLEVNWIEHDLDQPWPFDRDYSLIVVLWYVDLPLITRLCDCLEPGGYLLCEEHLQSDADVIGPRSPEFRVAPGALRDAVAGLEILHYAESIENNVEGEKVASARVVGRKN